MSVKQDTLSVGGLTLGVTRHTPAPGRDQHRAVLYFHGGGLLYGERDDLPRVYIDLFLQRGYTIFAFDYPLAPETPLAGIHEAVLCCARWFLEGAYRREGFRSYFLFGRSAGAYLALILAKQLCAHPEYTAPAGILDFYGYYDLRCGLLSQPSPYYDGLPPVSKDTVDKLTAGGPVSTGPKPLRFSLYVYARQQRCWDAMLGVKEAGLDRCSLSNEEIASLPPLFITASSGDQDVPMGVSKALARSAPAARTKWVYYLEHDFDRDVSDPTGLAVYRDCLDWMDGVCGE